MTILRKIPLCIAQGIVMALLVLTAPIWIAMLVHFVKHLDA